MGATPTPFLVRTNTSTTNRLRAAVYQSQNQKPSSPIAIPRRKTAQPPPRSPIRQQPSPDLMFNFDFSVSPRSFQGKGLSLKDEWAQPLLQQRGHAGVLLAQCLPKTMYTDERDVDSDVPRPNHGTKFQDGPVVCPASQGPMQGMRVEDENTEVGNGAGEMVHTLPSVSPPSSVFSSSTCSSVAFAAITGDVQVSETPHYTQNTRYEMESEHQHLISAFQGSLTSGTLASVASVASVESSSLSPEPSSAMLFRPPSPISPPISHPSQRPRLIMPTMFSRSPSHAHIVRTAAAPVVSLKVVEAEGTPRGPKTGSSPPSSGTVRVRDMLPYPGAGLRVRRSSSVGSSRRPNIVGGRVLGMRFGNKQRVASLVLTNEELERSLELAAQPDETLKYCRCDGHASKEIKHREVDRGRTRNRAVTRSDSVLRALRI